MNLQITFRSLAHSDALEAYAQENLKKIQEFIQKTDKEPCSIHLIITGGFVHAHHKVELLVKTAHYDLVAHRELPDAYIAIKEVIHVMESELKKAKEKLVKTRHTGTKKRTPGAIEQEFSEEEPA